jgi:hypothetical protein
MTEMDETLPPVFAFGAANHGPATLAQTTVKPQRERHKEEANPTIGGAGADRNKNPGPAIYR